MRKRSIDKVLGGLLDDLTNARTLWNNKLSKIKIKDVHKSYYIMGVIGGLIIAIELIKGKKDV
tara:strand:+ start:1513 stop:1701 length:189 start_codon:yes stop_codon:yes gene_type:complete